MKVIKPNNGEPFHQAEFECACGVTGHIQTTEDTVFCPVCGSAEGIEVWESEFTIVEGELTPPQPPAVKEIVYKEKIVYRSRPRTATPTTGHRGVRPGTVHKVVNTPPVITSVLRDGKLRIYTVDCGHTGERTIITAHLDAWHGMSHQQAMDAVKVENHDARDERTTRIYCEAPGAHPIQCQVVGFELGDGGDKHYRFRVKECNYTGPRTSVLKHIVHHHGYTRDEARLLINLKAGNVERLDNP